MKRYILILCVFSLFSCKSYLDIVPDNVATLEIAFQTRGSAERFLATIYSYIPEQASLEQNFGMVAGDEIWYYGEKDFYLNNETSLRLAKGMQNTIDPYLNFWEGRQGAYNLFVSIRDCNIFLENLKDIPGLNTDEKNRWIAEAKTLKAYFHFLLLQMYGPIPIVDKNIPVDAPSAETHVERKSVDEVVKYITALLDEVVKSGALPDKIRFIQTENGRITLPAAKAIKAKILMLAASPLFNGNSDYAGFNDKKGLALVNQTFDPLKWVAAQDACLDAIQTAESAGHELFSFTNLLPIGTISQEVRQELTLRATITDRYNKEMIFGVGPNSVNALQAWCQPRWTGDHAADFGNTRKSHAPTLNVVEDFYSSNGLPINEDKTWNYNDRFSLVKVTDALASDHRYYLQNNYTTAKLHTYREPRFYAYVGFDGGKWFSMETSDTENIPYLNAKAGQFSGKAGTEIYSITGYFTKKLVNYENVITRNTTTIQEYTFPIIRLSDLYLMYSEALNEVKGAPDAEVYKYIQKVRDKAGLDKGSDLVSTWNQYSNHPEKPKSKEGMRTIIQKERMIELAFEGHRYWDLRRWKLAGDYFNRPIRGWNIYAGDTKDFYQVKNIFYRDFLIKDYLWPISQNEMLRNPNLVQSPGW